MTQELSGTRARTYVAQRVEDRSVDAESADLLTAQLLSSARRRERHGA